jgi:hypothetical protein
MKQAKNESVEVYYERLLKLANSLQHKQHLIFKSGLQPFLHVETTCMKKKTMQQHNEAALVHEEGILK